MRVSHVPTYSQGPATILDWAPCNLSYDPFEVVLEPRHASITYTDADPAKVQREARAAALRRTKAAAHMNDRHAAR